jgi:hypothetical protein
VFFHLRGQVHPAHRLVCVDSRLDSLVTITLSH